MKHRIHSLFRYLLRQLIAVNAGRWIACLLLITAPLQLPAADHQILTEHKLKVALLYKLTRFVEWPKRNKSVQQDFFGICVLGKDGFGAELDILEKRKATGLPIRLYRYSNSASIEDHCHVLLVAESKSPFLQSIFENLNNRAILTVGDFTSFAEKGGMVQITYDNNKFGFIINLKNARQSKLKIAAPLLELATVIGKNPEGGEQ